MSKIKNEKLKNKSEFEIQKSVNKNSSTSKSLNPNDYTYKKKLIKVNLNLKKKLNIKSNFMTIPKQKNGNEFSEIKTENKNIKNKNCISKERYLSNTHISNLLSNKFNHRNTHSHLIEKRKNVKKKYQIKTFSKSYVNPFTTLIPKKKITSFLNIY